MICVITTDAEAENAYLAQVIEKAVNASFNKITVDNDMSTNDTVLLLANGSSGVKIAAGSEGSGQFENAVRMVAEHLARSIVYDGEGVSKFVSVEVSGAANDRDAELAELMKHREFSIKVELGEGSANCTIWTGDFTYEYVKINADYHT